MNSAELVAAIRLAAYIGDNDPEYTDAVIRSLASNMLWNTFGEIMVRARQGYWRQKKEYTTEVGTSVYRVPSRALGGAIEMVEVPYGSAYRKLGNVDPRLAIQLEGQSGFPTAYSVDADMITLYPTPSSEFTMRVTYQVRPSTLVEPQTVGIVEDVDNDPAGPSITIDAPPDNQVTGNPIAPGDYVDVVHPGGTFELGLVDGYYPSGLGNIMFFPVGTDLSRVAVGDYVRAAEQTDWPALPVEYHQTLADATAAELLLQKGAAQKAGQLASKAASAIEKMRTLLEPRAKWDPSALRRSNTFFRRGAWPRFPIAGS